MSARTDNPLLKVLIHKDGRVTFPDLWRELKNDLPNGSFVERTWMGQGESAAEEGTLAVTHVGHHFGEERILRGQGSTACVYFQKCNLHCRDCTNDSRWRAMHLEPAQLTEKISALIEDGAKAVSFVSPTIYWRDLLPVLTELKEEHPAIPLIYNCGGYENPQSLQEVSHFIDVFQPDFKAVSDEACTHIPLPRDYVERFHRGIKCMSAGRKLVCENGLLKRGVLVRHLLLPDFPEELTRVLRSLTPYRNQILLNVMTKYYRPEENRIIELGLAESTSKMLETFLVLVDGLPFSERAKEFIQ